jgi:hypothetical protein
LVPAEVELAFPETDPVLSNKVVAVVRETVRQRELLAMRFGGGGYDQDGDFEGDAGAGNPGGNGNSPGMAYAGSGQPATAGAADGTSREPAGSTSPAASTLPVLSTAKMSRGSTSGAIGESNLQGFSAMPDHSRSTGSLPGNGAASRGSPTGPVYDNAYGSGLADAGTNANAQPSTQATALNSLNAADGSFAGETNPGGQFADGAAVGSAVSSPSTSTASGTSTSRTTADGSGGTGAAQSSGQVAQNSQGQSGQTGNSDSQPTNTPQSPNINMTASNTPPVKRVGKDWALPPDISSSRGTEMLRIIRVECYSDRFVLIGEGGRGVPTVIPFADGNINEASLTLATAVRDRASTWGAAMQGARWQPVLEVAVAPGAEFRYQQLTRLFEGSGLLIQAKGAR